MDVVKYEDVKFKFYAGLTYSQFLALWEFQGPAANKLVHWGRAQKGNTKTAGKSPEKCLGPPRKLTPQNELFLTLVRLRCGLLNRDLVYRFGISESSVSDIVTTWVQFLFLQFSRIRRRMFTDRELIRANVPQCFSKFRL